MGAPDTQRYLELTESYSNLFLDTTMALHPQSPMKISVPTQLLQRHASNLLYGSDYPNTPYEYANDIKSVAELFPSLADRTAVFESNADKLLKAKAQFI